LLGRVISLPWNRKRGLYPVVVLGVALYAIRKNGTVQARYKLWVFSMNYFCVLSIYFRD
jgi:hypothetical protein